MLGQYYVIMDFISSGSLRTLLFQRDARLPLRRALDLTRQAADGIAAAHARGTLHRDLKPENFLIEEQGAVDIVRMADFGLTRLAETGLTIDGSLAFGSLPYMSPEQLRGLPIDARSDLYSLGVVLYEVVTGFPPFQVKNLGDALSKHLTAQPVRAALVVAERSAWSRAAHSSGAREDRRQPDPERERILGGAARRD